MAVPLFHLVETCSNYCEEDIIDALIGSLERQSLEEVNGELEQRLEDLRTLRQKWSNENDARRIH